MASTSPLLFAEYPAVPPGGGGRYHLYASHGLSKFSDRLWAFAVPVLLIYLWPGSFLPAAVFNLSLYIGCFVFMVRIGVFVDSNDRLYVVRTSIVMQKISILVSCVLLISLIYISRGTPSEKHLSSLPEILCFSGILLFALVGELFGKAGCISLEKDWVVVLASDENCLPLRSLNTNLQRIDLLCKFLAPGLFGLFISVFHRNNPTQKERDFMVKIGSSFVIVWNLLSMIPEYWLAKILYDRVPDLQVRNPVPSVRESSDASDANLLVEDNEEFSDIGGNGTIYHDETNSETNIEMLDIHDPNSETNIESFDINEKKSFISGWRTFFNSEVSIPSFGYCLLYLTVLSNGTLMTQFLLHKNLSTAVLGFARGIGALFGILGTLVYPKLMKSPCMQRNSLERGGVITVWLFFFCVVPGGLLVILYQNGYFTGRSEWYFFGESPDKFVPNGLLGFTIIARAWLWAFDINHSQVMQERVDANKIGVVNGCQTALYQFMMMLMAILGIIFSAPNQFYVLVSVSIVAVCSSAIAYSYWMYRNERNIPIQVENSIDSEEL